MHHAPIALRIGRENSNVDNIHAGGLVIGVEDNGQLLPTAYELGYGDRNTQYTHHPDTNVCFEEIVLPNIVETIRASYQMHGKFPHIGIISWDFTVNDQNQTVLVEANIMGQSVWFPQIVHGKGIFGDQTESVLQMIIRGRKG
jgi:D-alanine-D-alanine ligase-like ATP-grasp enzyme